MQCTSGSSKCSAELRLSAACKCSCQGVFFQIRDAPCPLNDCIIFVGCPVCMWESHDLRWWLLLKELPAALLLAHKIPGNVFDFIEGHGSPDIQRPVENWMSGLSNAWWRSVPAALRYARRSSPSSSSSALRSWPPALSDWPPALSDFPGLHLPPRVGAGLLDCPVESHQFDHCTSMFHVGAPLKGAWLVLDDPVQELHTTTLVDANDCECIALEVLRENTGEPFPRFQVYCLLPSRLSTQPACTRHMDATTSLASPSKPCSQHWVSTFPTIL